MMYMLIRLVKKNCLELAWICTLLVYLFVATLIVFPLGKNNIVIFNCSITIEIKRQSPRWRAIESIGSYNGILLLLGQGSRTG